MKKNLSILLIFSLCSVFAFAGNESKENKSKNETNVEQIVTSAHLSGTIIDLKNNETLAGASILVDGKKIYSDLDGNFNLSALTLGRHTISVEMISYNNAQLEIDVQKDTQLNIQLVQQ